jgi:hypothetical protein
VRFFAPVPSALTTQMSLTRMPAAPGFGADRNARRDPSGDHDGSNSLAGPLVRRLSPLPSTREMQMSPELRASFRWQPNAICRSGIRSRADPALVGSFGGGWVVEWFASEGEPLQPTLVPVNNMASTTVVEGRW